MTRYIIALAAVVATAPPICRAQEAKIDCAAIAAAPVDHGNMDHGAHLAALEKCNTGPVPTAAGQAAYGAISEIVRMLKADPKTDWSKVNVEALRQHLIDMNEVTMQANAVQRNIPGGIEVDVTGTGRTMSAIRRMTVNHTSMLDKSDDYHASAKEIPEGARLTITAKNASDAAVVARIRGLGFAGLMTEGDHHASHHLALARGEPVHGR
jgi:hypothetical protein